MEHAVKESIEIIMELVSVTVVLSLFMISVYAGYLSSILERLC